MNNIDFKKNSGLVPVVVQNANNHKVLMLGYMNKEALTKTLQQKKVWFFSRSKQCLWMKGESSGNELLVKQVFKDCDGDALLILADPQGPTCHTNQESCFFCEIMYVGAGDD